jgi:hypothetical protein
MHSTLYTIHGHNDVRVGEIMSEMQKLGAPHIRVVDCGDHYMAIEGTHRLEAAARLGLAPVLVVLDQDEMVEADSLDLDLLNGEESYTAGEIAGEVYTPGSGCYHLSEDGLLTLAFNGSWVPTYSPSEGPPEDFPPMSP